jgi:hypothetical protein
MFRREKCGIHTARHQLAGTLRGALQQTAERGIRREQDAGQRIEARTGKEACVFNLLRRSRCGSLRQTLQEPLGALSCVLMHVGVPGRNQRQMIMVGHDGANHAEVIGAGDVDDVRTKIAQCAGNDRQMAKESEIEAQIFFQTEGERPARELKRRKLAFCQQARHTSAGADRKKWQIPAADECLKLAAGMGHTIDLVERVREIGHARRCGKHTKGVYMQPGNAR